MFRAWRASSTIPAGMERGQRTASSDAFRVVGGPSRINPPPSRLGDFEPVLLGRLEIDRFAQARPGENGVAAAESRAEAVHQDKRMLFAG